MGIAKNFFQRRFGKLNVNKSGNGYKLNIDYSVLGKKIDKAQDALDAVIWDDMKKLMPIDSGQLIARTEMLNKATRGEVYIYDNSLPYAHYQYEGKLYVDPVYKVGAFYNPNYGFWSRPGVKKEKTDIPLQYQNFYAQPHWDEVAKSRYGAKWLETARKAIK